MVAHALELVVAVHHRQHKAQIIGHRLLEREQLNAVLIDGVLKGINELIALNDCFDLIIAAIHQLSQALIERRFDQGAHVQQVLFQLIKIVFQGHV